MKLKINNFDEKSLRSKLNGLSDIDFSLFIDSVPELNDTSSINVLVLQEPNEYFGLHDWAIQNKDLFGAIDDYLDVIILDHIIDSIDENNLVKILNYLSRTNLSRFELVFSTAT